MAGAGAATAPAGKPLSARLLSLDLYRGLAVAGMILVDNPGDEAAAYRPIRHAEWNGWTPADFVFPSFLFIVGVALALAFSARLERGESRAHILAHAVKRSLILVGIGLFVNGFPNSYNPATLRIEGVLQRIAICYAAAAVLFLWSERRGPIAAVAVCLAGYWALMRLVPVPGIGLPGRDVPFLDPDRNLVAWLDRRLFMGHLYENTRDPEGLISTIPAIATTLIGVLTGGWLRSSRGFAVKARGMVLSGILCLAAGAVLDIWFPINKKLWTSSFVLFTAGVALLLFSLLYCAVEIRHARGGWTMLPLVFGMNPIAGFIADALVYRPMDAFHVNGLNKAILLREYSNARLLALTGDPALASLLYSLTAVLFCWTLLWLLYRRRIFFKI